MGTIDLQLGRGSVADALPAPLWLSAFFPLAQQHFSAESQMAPSKMSVFPAESGKPDRSLVWRNWLIQGAVGAGTAAALCTTTVLWAGSSHSLSCPVPYPQKKQWVHVTLSHFWPVYSRDLHLWEGTSDLTQKCYLPCISRTCIFSFPMRFLTLAQHLPGCGHWNPRVKCQLEKWSTSVLSIRSWWAGLLWNSAVQSHLQAGQVGMPSALFLLPWESTGTGAKWCLCKGSIVSLTSV